MKIPIIPEQQTGSEHKVVKIILASARSFTIIISLFDSTCKFFDTSGLR
jgi:hypothetical protein